MLLLRILHLLWIFRVACLFNESNATFLTFYGDEALGTVEIISDFLFGREHFRVIIATLGLCFFLN